MSKGAATWSRSWRTPLEERFWPKVEKAGADDCWLWRGTTTVEGYGHVCIAPKKTARAHRVSWEMAYGPIPPRMSVLHRCDVRNCVNPRHLFLGTQLDNIADMVSKKRHRSPTGEEHWTHKHPEKIARGDACGFRRHPEKIVRGEKQHLAKLTEQDVRDIRAMYAAKVLNQKEIAAQYGMDPTTISGIILRKHWKHVA